MNEDLKKTGRSIRTKRLGAFAIAMAAGLVCLHPGDVSGKDHDEKKDKKSQKHSDKGVARVIQGAPEGESHGGKVRNHAHTANSALQGQANVFQAATESAFQKGGRGVVSRSPAMSQHVEGGTRHLQSQRIQNPAQFSLPQGNRSNRYGGRWVEATTHADWDRRSDHYWNNHHYRWYDGGWLIVLSGNTREYSNAGSLASEVQQRLAARGYYNGGIDGDIGPASRRAIGRYQDDHDLRATGRINDALLESLRLD